MMFYTRTRDQHGLRDTPDQGIAPILEDNVGGPPFELFFSIALATRVHNLMLMKPKRKAMPVCLEIVQRKRPFGLIF
jgi:hypothetical protein